MVLVPIMNFNICAAKRKLWNVVAFLPKASYSSNSIKNPTLNLVPFVIEKTSSGERSFDIYSRLLKDRIVCLHGEVSGPLSSVIVAQLLYLESINPEKPIHLYLNCPGGIVSDGLAIYDTMQYVQCPIYTVCMGMAASMASLLLAAGAKGHRFSLPNSRVMIHQPIGGAQGQATDIAIHAKEILRIREQINSLYSKHTSKPISEIEKTMERDYWMSPLDALEYGLIDKVIEKRENPS